MNVSQLDSHAFRSNGTALTLGRGNVSNVVFGSLSGHRILEVGGKISGRMPLEHIVE